MRKRRRLKKGMNKWKNREDDEGYLMFSGLFTPFVGNPYSWSHKLQSFCHPWKQTEDLLKQSIPLQLFVSNQTPIQPPGATLVYLAQINMVFDCMVDAGIPFYRGNSWYPPSRLKVWKSLIWKEWETIYHKRQFVRIRQVNKISNQQQTK